MTGMVSIASILVDHKTILVDLKDYISGFERLYCITNLLIPTNQLTLCKYKGKDPSKARLFNLTNLAFNGNISSHNKCWGQKPALTICAFT